MMSKDYDDVVEITGMDHFGRGICKIENIPVFVVNAVVGDKLKIKIIKEKNNYKEAVIKQIVIPSRFRVDNLCIYSNKCGGCELLNISYGRALDYKQKKVDEIINKFVGQDIKIKAIVYDEQFNYRNKIILHIKNNKLGLYEKCSNNLVDIKKCLLTNNKMNDTITQIDQYIKNHSHQLTEVMLRIDNKSKIMLVFKGNGSKKELTSYFSNVDSLWLNNDLLLGEKYLEVELNNYHFKLSFKSFFQVNYKVATKMFNYIIDYLKDKHFNEVLDLYCGTGVIGILISSYVNHVTGIEIVEEAILDAKINKKKNNVKNVSFICGRTEDYIDRFNNIDLIIIDPPRKGLDKKTRANIVRIKPKEIIYVSCDPVTLARDINCLSEDYNVLELTLFDMFPNTYHVECVCVLNRR